MAEHGRGLRCAPKVWSADDEHCGGQSDYIMQFFFLIISLIFIPVRGAEFNLGLLFKFCLLPRL